MKRQLFELPPTKDVSIPNGNLPRKSLSVVLNAVHCPPT
jgi:hypothetical protein